QPNNPYFRELKGQALFEAGHVAEAVAPLRKAMSMLPDEGLIRILLAQALVATNRPKADDEALAQLRKAARTETDSPTLHQQLAIVYARKGDLGRADLASAEAAFAQGDLDLAKLRAKRARAQLKEG